ncbi:DNA-binding response regulator [Pseudonocardia sp. CNS-139]|nr:DNA-binding response regulator [Pseudonocardia sp. CNS-139]
MIRLVIVDDEPMVCEHLRTIVGSAEDIDVVGIAHDGAEALETVVRRSPDVVLMDLRMPGVDGLTATARMAALPDPPIVVVLTTFEADDYVLRALRAGAAGFLLKSTPPEDLIGLVRVAADGHAVLSPKVVTRLVAASSRAQVRAEEARGRLTRLTDRELDVLRLLGAGLANADIARELFLSEATVKSYVSRMLDKLGCANRTQAGLLAVEAGLAR